MWGILELVRRRELLEPLTGGAALAMTGGLGGAVGGAIAGFVGGTTSGFILGGGNTLMAGGSLYDAWSNGLTGAYMGACYRACFWRNRWRIYFLFER